MKITKSVLKQIIKEELKYIEEISDIPAEIANNSSYKLGVLAQAVIIDCTKIKKFISSEKTPDKIKLELIIKTVEELQKRAEEILPQIK